MRGDNRCPNRNLITLEMFKIEIDELDWDKPDADEKDERLNEAWNIIDEAIHSIEEIKEI